MEDLSNIIKILGANISTYDQDKAIEIQKKKNNKQKSRTSSTAKIRSKLKNLIKSLKKKSKSSRILSI